MRRTEPLFRLDPGWLFTLAGLAIIVSAALIPVDRGLHEMRQQLEAIQARQSLNDRRLQAYDGFLKELAAKDPALMRRLAASQLNLMPEGERPLLMATSIEHTVSDWIEAAVEQSEHEPVPLPDTLLSRLAGGSRRLWLMGGGAMMVFVGLLSGIGVSARPTLPTPAAPSLADARDSSAEIEDVPAVMDGPEVAAVQDRAWVAAAEWSGDAVSTHDGAQGTEAETELPDESTELDPDRATASAVQVDSYEWAEPVPPFEAPEADSGCTPDAAGSTGDPQADAPAADADAQFWMRDHGSD